MPADAYVSALILYQLGEQPMFRRAVRVYDAVSWFGANDRSLDDDTRLLWNRARARCGVQPAQSLLHSHRQ